MADATLRTFERRWTESDAKQDELALLRRLRGIGSLDDVTLELAAFLDHPGAVALRGAPVLSLTPAAQALLDEHLARLTFVQREMVKLRAGWADGNVYSAEEIGRIFKRDPADVVEACGSFRAGLAQRLLLGDMLEIALEAPACADCGEEHSR